MLSYDFSTVLYLHDLPADAGGEFAFLDAAEAQVVRPRRGQLLAFTSGAENVHAVLPSPATHCRTGADEICSS